MDFPERITCHGCGQARLVLRRERYDMPEGTAGVAWARCRKCRHEFIRFIGEGAALSRLKARWLGLEQD